LRTEQKGGNDEGTGNKDSSSIIDIGSRETGDRDRYQGAARNGDMPPVQSKAEIQKQRAKVTSFLCFRFGGEEVQELN
jgi:hypothetical protein